MALLGWVALAGVASGQEPFLPGQMKSQALAELTWHPPCAAVGLAPATTADIAAAPDHMQALAIAWPGTCRIAMNLRSIKSLVYTFRPGAFKRTVRREWELVTCTLIVHEYGHLAGQEHSTDPNNVMFPTFTYTYPPCRALFPRVTGRVVRSPLPHG